MRLKSIELSGFKSFAKKTPLEFGTAITAVVGPNGSGKSNIAESFRFVLGEQSMKSMRGRKGEDLIWNGSGASPRSGRASVKLVFDNADRKLNLDFDEVVIERVVHRDGGNDYLLNGSTVRLRDVSELLSQANIGSSGHHIISQGEADRILSTGSRERREMVEDALGLTAYLYKREEAERKLAKAAENIREVEALRRELGPHLKFLATQVKKIQEGEALRSELALRYLEYLKREHVHLSAEKAQLEEEGAAPRKERQMLEGKIGNVRAELSRTHGADTGTRELMALEEKGSAASARRAELTRELGRIEGELSARARLSREALESVPGSQAREFAGRVERELAEAMNDDPSRIKNRLSALIVLAQEFLRRISKQSPFAADGREDVESKKRSLESELGTLTKEEQRIQKEVAALRSAIEGEKDASREAERELFAAMSRRGELDVLLANLHAREEILAREAEQFKTELGEAGALIGRAVLDYESHVVRGEGGEVFSNAELAEEERSGQEARRKKLERMKIKIEEVGLGNASEILKEHQDTSERDQFLSRELADIEASAESLRALIGELTETLQTRFADGVDKINTEFEAFFRLMFGGGEAKLHIIKERKLRRGAPEDVAEEEDEEDKKEEFEEGIDITISLPHKRVKGLHMLSGGERALTSIALIFAMSQVNPPPFLILDETDAALDEANSRRYGDMIETLARKSQLILITHNRETMSRAGILYGITMGSDGVSKLLSVQFEEAVAVAK